MPLQHEWDSFGNFVSMAGKTSNHQEVKREKDAFYGCIGRVVLIQDILVN